MVKKVNVKQKKVSGKTDKQENLKKNSAKKSWAKGISVKTMVTGALLTALVIILQSLGAAIKFGPFSVSLVLIPIAIGAITCGKSIGAWLGFVFGAVVLASGDAQSFWVVNVSGTIITVLLKGMACGFVTGLVYELLVKLFCKNRPNMQFVAAVIASLVCPVVNSGVFFLGCLVFFMETIKLWAGGGDAAMYVIVTLIGVNFLFEMAVSIIFAPALSHIIKVVNKK